MKKVMVYIIDFCVAGFLPLSAQQVAVKTNLLYDATATISLGVEKMFGTRHSLDLSASYNPWTFSGNKKWKHFIVQPEWRWWYCKKLNGHFVGMHIHGGLFNFGNLDIPVSFLGTDFSRLKSARYEGWTVGAGISYGYSWLLGRHWNLEAQIGVGYAYSDYDQYSCSRCSEQLRSGRHHYFGPTRLAVNLVYVF